MPIRPSACRRTPADVALGRSRSAVEDGPGCAPRPVGLGGALVELLRVVEAVARDRLPADVRPVQRAVAVATQVAVDLETGDRRTGDRPAVARDDARTATPPAQRAVRRAPRTARRPPERSPRAPPAAQPAGRVLRPRVLPRPAPPRVAGSRHPSTASLSSPRSWEPDRWESPPPQSPETCPRTRARSRRRPRALRHTSASGVRSCAPESALDACGGADPHQRRARKYD